jgi:hypothetical protein
LWDEVEAAFRSWAAAGKPPLDRSQITITPDSQTVSVTHPTRSVAGR